MPGSTITAGGSQMTDVPATVHHLGLTMTDPEVSRQWYQRLLNAAPVLGEDFPAEHHEPPTQRGRP
jgi:hypothetical protein